MRHSSFFCVDFRLPHPRWEEIPRNDAMAASRTEKFKFQRPWSSLIHLFFLSCWQGFQEKLSQTPTLKKWTLITLISIHAWILIPSEMLAVAEFSKLKQSQPFPEMELSSLKVWRLMSKPDTQRATVGAQYHGCEDSCFLLCAAKCPLSCVH